MRDSWSLFLFVFWSILFVTPAKSEANGIYQYNVGGQVYVLTRHIGYGTFADVFIAEELSTGRQVALRILSTPRTDSDGMPNINNEYLEIDPFNHQRMAQAQARIERNHTLSPRIMRVLGVHKSPDKNLSSLIAAELLERSLEADEHRRRYQAGSPDIDSQELNQRIENLYFLTLHLIKGAAEIANLGFSHNDIKEKNILFRRIAGGHWLPVYGDFGLLTTQNEFPPPLRGGAPEFRDGFTKSMPISDFYILGKTIERVGFIAPYRRQSADLRFRSIDSLEKSSELSDRARHQLAFLKKFIRAALTHDWLERIRALNAVEPRLFVIGLRDQLTTFEVSIDENLELPVFEPSNEEIFLGGTQQTVQKKNRIARMIHASVSNCRKWLGRIGLKEDP